LNDYFFFSAPQLKRDPLDCAMRTVLQTTDRALVEAVRLALEGQGIASVVQNDVGASLPFMPASIMVQDSEYDRARSVVKEFDEGVEHQLSKAPWRVRAPRLLLLLVLALVAVVCAEVFLP
jgi:hypothetical protein